jgi:probable selenium-dependent hydroxylase accessory protein YqeC
MTASLASRLGLQERDLVAFVGAGGKTSLLLALGRELAARDARLVMTTTTKMGPDQVPAWSELCRTPEEVTAALDRRRPAFLVGSVTPSKITGVASELVNRVFDDAAAAFVLVEADGARRRLLKAPAPHEPVIPASATLVVVVANTAAVGRPIHEVAHRPERVSSLLGVTGDHVLRPVDVATVLSAPTGGLFGVPERARVVVALTTAGGRDDASAEVSSRLEPIPRIERVVTVALDRLARPHQ